MKKLMIALGAAASMAWCANAVESQVVSAIDFDSLTVGATLDKNMEETTGEFVGQVFWASDATELSSTIKERSSGNNYLAVDETEVLERKMKPTGSTSLADNGVYFSADVQFTASDETSGEGMVAEGDKLLVWLRATEAVEAVMDGKTVVTPAVPATTNLIITAMNADGTGFADYVVANSGEGGINIDPATWYTLTIKAKQTGGVGEETAEFEVYVGDTKLASGQKTSFTSLVAAGGTTSTTITSVGFKGTGALDNLEFGTFTEVVQKCTVSVSVTYEEGTMLGIMVDGSEPDELPCEKEYTIASGAKSTIVVTVDDGYVVTYNNKTYKPVEGDCTIEIDLSEAEPNSTVNVDLAVVEAGDEPTTEFPSTWNGSSTPDQAIITKFGTWASTYGVTASTATAAQENAFLLNIDPTEEDQSFKVTSIVIEDGKVKITTSPASTGVNGKVYLYKGDSPTSLTKQQDAIEGGDLTTILYDSTKGEQFYKVEVGY